MSTSVIDDSDPQRLGRFDDAGGGTAHAVRSVAVTLTSCCGPMTRVVGIP